MISTPTELAPPAGSAPAPAPLLPAWLLSDLRTDHAGETGAVMIYRGMLSTSRDPAVVAFAQAHMAAEARHLAAVALLVGPQHRSRLLPLWCLAGWLTGALPALVGARAVYATVEAVETFVDHHYTVQIDAIDRHDPRQADAGLQAVRAQLHAFRADEIGHRDDAAARFDHQAGRPSALLRLWIRAVGAGSRGAVQICRRV